VLTQLELELGTGLEALLSTLEAADPRDQVGTIYNGYQFETARAALKEFQFSRKRESFNPSWSHRFFGRIFQFVHSWYDDCTALVRTCRICGKTRWVPPSRLHQQFRVKPMVGASDSPGLKSTPQHQPVSHSG
jgi:hypothetical protein